MPEMPVLWRKRHENFGWGLPSGIVPQLLSRKVYLPIAGEIHALATLQS
jgi:hypothetical protein